MKGGERYEEEATPWFYKLLDDFIKLESDVIVWIYGIRFGSFEKPIGYFSEHILSVYMKYIYCS